MEFTPFPHFDLNTRNYPKSQNCELEFQTSTSGQPKH